MTDVFEPMRRARRTGTQEGVIAQGFRAIDRRVILALAALVATGCVIMYSLANGSLEPWALRHIVRFAGGLVILLAIAFLNPRLWITLAYPAWGIAVLLLIGVDVLGVVRSGAQRWIDLGFMNLQPSELAKLGLVLALARYFHCLGFDKISHIRSLVPPAVLILVPVLLVLRQPDLGTAVLILALGGGLCFLAGVAARYFATAGVLALIAIPVGWQFLRDYQKERLLTFLNPDRDPLGAGYHILQSKIALGAGGFFGKGFMQGTQSQLNFIPEKQTDFVFTMLGEEFGMAGALFVLGLYAALMIMGVGIALQSRNHFGRLIAAGVCLLLFLHVFVNISMVMGLLPVVGVPLPFLSYGGSMMLTMMLGFGLLMSVHIHRQTEISRTPATAFW